MDRVVLIESIISISPTTTISQMKESMMVLMQAIIIIATNQAHTKRVI